MKKMMEDGEKKERIKMNLLALRAAKTRKFSEKANSMK